MFQEIILIYSEIYTNLINKLWTKLLVFNVVYIVITMLQHYPLLSLSLSQVFVIAALKLWASKYVQHTLHRHLIKTWYVPITNMITSERTFVFVAIRSVCTISFTSLAETTGQRQMISHQLGRRIPPSHPFTQESNNHFGHKMSHFNSLFFFFSWRPFSWFVFLLPQAIISTGDSDKYGASSVQLNSWFYSFVLLWLIATVCKTKIYWFLFSTESVFYFSDMTYYVTW